MKTYFQIPILRITERVLLAAGVGILAYTLGVFAYAGLYQNYQSWQFDQEVVALPVIEAAVVKEVFDFSEGGRLGRLEIPRIGVSVMVLHGIDEGTLILGAGHVPGTPLPGVDGNVVVAGHRDTFFRNLEGILPGDLIEFQTIRQTHTYVVSSTEIVRPEDTYVMESRARPELTLITCYPFYFVGAAPERFIVHATSVPDIEPVKALTGHGL